MRTRARPRRSRLALWVMRALVLGMLVWQGALIEIVESHDLSAACEDDRGQPCDCGPNCHCCLTCAHQGLPGLPSFGLADSPIALLDFVELPLMQSEQALDSLERGPPAKVPKLLV